MQLLRRQFLKLSGVAASRHAALGRAGEAQYDYRPLSQYIEMFIIEDLRAWGYVK